MPPLTSSRPAPCRPKQQAEHAAWSDGSDENGVVDSVEFHLGYGDMIRLLRSSGFEVEDLIEIQPTEVPSVAKLDTPWEWAGRWPSVEAWKATKGPVSGSGHD
jgi:hypothetical protein